MYCVLGHEGGGIVEGVGRGVTSVKPGEHACILEKDVKLSREWCR